MRLIGILLVAWLLFCILLAADVFGQTKKTNMAFKSYATSIDSTLMRDSVTTATTLTGNDTLEFTHYQPSTYTDRLLTVAVYINSALDQVSGVEVVGDSVRAMTAIQELAVGGTPSARLYAYYLKNPDTGSVTVRVKLTVSTRTILASAISWSGVDQSTPLSAADTTSGSGTQSSLNVTTTTSDGIVMAYSGCQNSGSPNGGETEIFDVMSPTWYEWHSGYYQAGTGGTVNINIAYSSGGGEYAVIGFNIRQDP